MTSKGRKLAVGIAAGVVLVGVGIYAGIAIGHRAVPTPSESAVTTATPSSSAVSSALTSDLSSTFSASSAQVATPAVTLPTVELYKQIANLSLGDARDAHTFSSWYADKLTCAKNAPKALAMDCIGDLTDTTDPEHSADPNATTLVRDWNNVAAQKEKFADQYPNYGVLYSETAAPDAVIPGPDTLGQFTVQMTPTIEDTVGQFATSSGVPGSVTFSRLTNGSVVYAPSFILGS